MSIHHQHVASESVLVAMALHSLQSLVLWVPLLMIFHCRRPFIIICFSPLPLLPLFFIGLSIHLTRWTTLMWAWIFIWIKYPPEKVDNANVYRAYWHFLPSDVKEWKIKFYFQRVTNWACSCILQSALPTTHLSHSNNTLCYMDFIFMYQ